MLLVLEVTNLKHPIIKLGLIMEDKSRGHWTTDCVRVCELPKSSLIRFSLISVLILVVKVKFDYIQFDFNSWLAFQYQHLFGYYLILRVRIVWDLWRSWYAEGIGGCRKQVETGRQYFCNITSASAKAFPSFYSKPSLVHFCMGSSIQVSITPVAKTSCNLKLQKKQTGT